MTVGERERETQHERERDRDQRTVVSKKTNNARTQNGLIVPISPSPQTIQELLSTFHPPLPSLVTSHLFIGENCCITLTL